MSSLTNIIEAIVFASGEAVHTKYIVEKLGCSIKDVNAAVTELKEKFNAESGIQLLTFNGKLQFASNPKYKKEISEVLIPIKEKEFTRTILECAALIAYKQPVTKGELEEIRQVSCDYAIHTLLELEMICASGRRDTVGKPIEYSTTDNFLKRFKLNSIDELPDYNELMQQIAELNSSILGEEEDDAYLYKKDEYNGDDGAGAGASAKKPVKEEKTEKQPKMTEDGYEMPDFIDEDDDVIKID